MNELYALSQIIKSYPRFALDAFRWQQVFLKLAHEKNLCVEGVLQYTKNSWPEMFAYLDKNHRLFKDLRESLRPLELLGIQLVCYGTDDYPPECYRMDDPPFTLSYWGTPAWKTEQTLSVVGSREPQRETLEWIEQDLSPFVEKERVCVVSGGARGVDQKSHSVALRKKTPTVVVLPSGLGEMYPSTLKEWVTPVLSGGGAFLSEYDFQQRMHKHLFHHRNRLIAALGRATLIVEARRRSGTLITAQQAAQLGRAVWVVPGHPRDPHFQGSLDLLSEGAQVIRDAQDLTMFFHSELCQEKFPKAQIGGLLNNEPYI